MSKDDPFRVPWLTHAMGAVVHHFRWLFVSLGRMETAALQEQLHPVQALRPLYICGLARSGSTFLHLLLGGQPGVATHRVKDYPLVHTPFWSRQATTKLPPAPPRERAHGDRILIDASSPEALEEMVWMAFFPHCHGPRVSNVMDGEESHPEFEAYYRAHLRKLLLAEGATRYAAKANYHVARLRYLLRLFPDARFFIPVRDPVSHIASLMRQHRRFSEAQRRNPRALCHMRWVGHFEFGLDRRAMNLGSRARVAEVERAWMGDEVLGWALYWSMVHDHIADVLEPCAALRAACLVVRHEELCADPARAVREVFRHAELPSTEALVEAAAAGVSRSDYYEPSFTAGQLETVRKVTASAARRWGYD
jgi:hypothetical protein